MKKITLLLFLLSTAYSLSATAGLFKIEVSYYSEHKCPHQIQGEPTQLFTEVGTGFLYNDRYIITTYHTMASACNESIIVRDLNGKTHQAYFKAGDTLLDIAVLELCEAPVGLESYIISTRLPRNGQSVEIKGYTKTYRSPRAIQTQILSTEVCMPGCFGSHKLSLSLDKDIPKGYSGSPLMASGKVMGMLVASNPKENQAYAINSDMLRRKLNDLIDLGTIPRPFYGMVLSQTPEGVLLKDVLPSASFSIKKHKGSILKKIGNKEINDLVDARTALEKVENRTDKDLSLMFKASTGSTKNITLPYTRFSTTDREEIARYFSDNHLLPFTLESCYHSLEIDKPLKGNNINSGDTFEVVGFPQVSNGIRINDIWDLGLLLKTFSPTHSNLTFFFSGNRKVSIKMPELLMN